LDDCDESNGALRVVPGSHRLGRLTSSAALAARNQCGEHSVAVPRGGVMAMRPLLLHASSKACSGAPRRVLHFVFGPSDLPEGLRWPARKRAA
jgi:ectoine hydroxylase-related dioxygenase (phytanoyl-CoA dioxygenase family)